MKYWFFDGSDVIGPFTPKELAENKAFNGTSLICPEDFSEDGDQWQPAGMFAEFKALLAQNTEDTDEDTATFEEEMDSLLKERSPLLFEEAPTDGPGLEIPKKPSKPGPIEDYFNKIKKEDLGDILGIPDPNDNSDLDLAHALEVQLAKTASTRREHTLTEPPEEEEAPALEATHHVATATEVFATKAPLENPADTITMPTVPPATMPTVELPPATPPQAAAAPTDEPTSAPAPIAEPVTAVAGPEPTPEQTPSETAPQEVAAAPEEPAELIPQPIPDPAQLRAERVEVNSIRARLKQTQEMKDFLQETQSSRLKKEARTQRKLLVMLLAALAIVGALMLTLQFGKRRAAEPAPAATHVQELLAEPATPVVPPPAVRPQPVTQEQKALAIVQNYPLSGQRGTLANYLNRIYQTQLAQGYSASWAAEPLYKNTYIVKYRLTKTRKEPIIYVFQADVAANKLTGALNNISLDLVGKI